MPYYKTNAVYGRLEVMGQKSLVWAAGNAWCLIYGDEGRIPKVLANVRGMTSAASAEQQEITQRAFDAFQRLGQALGVPVIGIGFDDEAAEIDTVTYTAPDCSPSTEVDLIAFKAIMSKLGLPVQGGETPKAINSTESSAYHHWQRANLGRIKVSDLDLMRLNSDGMAVEVFELKRSFKGINEWKPYPVDYPNFELVAYLAERVGIPFRIVYNQVVNGHDNCSELKLFRFQASQVGGSRAMTFEQFSSGSYP